MLKLITGIALIIVSGFLSLFFFGFGVLGFIIGIILIVLGIKDIRKNKSKT
jgi:hypothetical protein